MANQHLQTLLDKEVSRKEFLGLSVLAVASVFGLGTLVKLFTGKSLTHHRTLDGYSGGDYGGKTEAKTS
jgi:hypothetical protein